MPGVVTQRRLAIGGAAAVATALIVWQVLARRPVPPPAQPVVTPAMFADMLSQLRSWNSPSDAELAEAVESLTRLLNTPFPETSLLRSTREAPRNQPGAR